jgi:hypothetical protein
MLFRSPLLSPDYLTKLLEDTTNIKEYMEFVDTSFANTVHNANAVVPKIMTVSEEI